MHSEDYLVKSTKPNVKDMTKPASIERIPPLIPAKTSKKVNEISKFFKSKKLAQANTSLNKSYAQASKTGSNMKSILKIKEAFSTLKVKSINNIQRLIKDTSKPKPCINMITKGLSRKQVIVHMNKENKRNFIEETLISLT